MRAHLSIVVAVAVVVVSGLAAQSIDPALTAAIAGRDKAAIARDVAGVDRYTADDYVAVNPQGVLNNKVQRLTGLKTPANPSAAPQQPLRTEAVRPYGSGAVVRMKGPNNRQLFVWVRNPIGWQAAAIHVVPDAMLPPLAPPERPKTPQPSTLSAPPGLTGDRAALFAVHKQIQDAFFAGDRATYARFTASQHVRLMPGLMRIAEETIAAVDGPRAQPTVTNLAVHVWDQLGVVRWQEGTQWLTRVFAKDASGWRQVATASSAVGKPAS
jgi:hypothetical protein